MSTQTHKRPETGARSPISKGNTSIRRVTGGAEIGRKRGKYGMHKPCTDSEDQNTLGTECAQAIHPKQNM